MLFNTNVKMTIAASLPRNSPGSAGIGGDVFAVGLVE